MIVDYPLPPIQPKSKIPKAKKPNPRDIIVTITSSIPRLEYFWFMMVWFVMGLIFFIMVTWLRYDSKIITPLENSMQGYSSGAVEQEYLTTWSECEWKPSLSTNWEVICLWE